LPKEKHFAGSLGSPGLLSNKEITDRLSSKKLIKRSKTLKYNDSEDEEVIIREIGSGGGGFSGERKVSEPIYDFGSREGSGGSGDSTHLEDFKILKFISKGSFGSVFLAYLPKTDKYFAIKCL